MEGSVILRRIAHHEEMIGFAERRISNALIFWLDEEDHEYLLRSIVWHKERIEILKAKLNQVL